MKLLGNLLWFVFGGLWMGLGWSLVGLLWCITIVGIPSGCSASSWQDWHFSRLAKVIVYGGGAPLVADEPAVAAVRRICPCHFRCAARAAVLHHHRRYPLLGCSALSLQKLALCPFGSSVAVPLCLLIPFVKRQKGAFSA